MKIFKCGDISAFDFMQFYRDAQKSSVTTFSDMLNKLEGVDVNDKFKMLLLQEKLF
jgi:ferritin